MDISIIFDKTQTFVGVKGLVFFGDTDHMLIYQRDGNTKRYPLYTDLPGGGAEPGESPFDTFRREIEEEFSLDIQPEEITYTKTYPSRFESGKTVFFLAAYLPPNAANGIAFGDEGLGYSIISVADFLKQPNTISDQRQQIKDYLDQIK